MNLRYILPLFFAATCSLNAQAAGDRWFDVEILVFKRNVDVQDNSEQLDQNNVYLKQRQRLEVIKAAPATSCLDGQPCLHQQNPVRLTDAQMVKGGHRLQRLNGLMLNEQLKRLNNHQLFTPLLHTAWRMPIQNKQNALPIHLFAGKNYALAMEQAGLSSNSSNTSTQPDQSMDVLAALQKKEILQDLYEIDGNLLIYVERYLHIDSQLIVRTETEKSVSSPLSVRGSETKAVEQDGVVQIVNQEPVQRNVRTEKAITETLFDQSTRLRSEEIHYFDHPLFGMIIQIRKIK
ncbi:CsiV family protein [Psychromonas sp. B3M02]|uniref:CsiV family protein n=1 Tax=Psychromonas sp. B3M02 TaxID=2267226 RepID=UPI0015F02860|nr:CsiV family protein [Psychromonas sp. B3M02]